MGPYAGADYTSLSLCGLTVDSNTITTGNPWPKLTLSVRDVGFGLRAAYGNRVSHKNMNPSLTCPFSLFISVAITHLFRDHTPAVLLPRKRSVKQGCQQKYLGHTAREKKPYSVLEINSRFHVQCTNRTNLCKKRLVVFLYNMHTEHIIHVF
jgi:hypothetical protein